MLEPCHFYSAMSCDALKSRGCRSAWLTRLQIRAPSASVAELLRAVFFEPDTASQSHPWRPSISWSWQARGWKRYERYRHAGACDARSPKRVVGSSNTHFKCSRIVVLSSWEWGLSYNFFVLSPLRVFVGVSCRLALPRSALKVQFLRLSHHVDSCSPPFANATIWKCRTASTTIHKQVSRKMGQIPVKLNFCILTFWIRHWSDVILCTLKVQNAARAMSKPHIGRMILLYSA